MARRAQGGGFRTRILPRYIPGTPVTTRDLNDTIGDRSERKSTALRW
jgi:hypothetical protein